MEISSVFADVSRSFLFALATLLPMLNPPAAAPIFLTLTEGASVPDRARLAKKVAINIFIMLAIAMVAGNIVLNFFGISLPIIRIGGGLLVIGTAWRLINASDFDAAHAQNMAESYSWVVSGCCPEQPVAPPLPVQPHPAPRPAAGISRAVPCCSPV